MNLENQLKECDKLYEWHDFKELLEKCDRILEKHPNNQNAIGYKGISQLFLGNPDDAVKTLEKGVEAYPNNYYLKNNLSMAYYDLGEYEKSLKCCEDGLKIKDFDWLWENKMKALIMLDRADEAIEIYGGLNDYEDYPIDRLLFDAGKYKKALDYYLGEEEFDLIDELKARILKHDPNAISEVGDYYMSWIDMIKFKHDVKLCLDCGGELIPILWGYPDNCDLEKSAKGELYLGGCVIIVPWDYHCKSCGHDLNLGYKGLEIECSDSKLYNYIEYQISEIIEKLKIGSRVFIKTRNTIMEELRNFDEGEFEAFVNHLLEVGYICEPKKNYIKLVDFDNYKTAKEYLDEGKYPAPQWLVYPQLPFGSEGWRWGYGEDYVKNLPRQSGEYEDLFPKPKYWLFEESENESANHPLLAYFWRENGKAKYSINDKGIKVNDFININQIDVFQSDMLRFNSIEHAILLSKYMHFKKCERDETLKSLKDGFELTEEEKQEWEIFKYSVCLNACYFKIMERDHLKKKLLDTGDEYLVYDSDDEWGREENLLGRALMEIRDEIRRLYKNEDKIDWEYTEYLKHKIW